MRALALALAAALTPLAAWAAGCATPGNLAALVSEAGAAINAQRSANGRQPLTDAPQLDEAAQKHACWMAETNTFSHRGEGGSLPEQRIKATGYRTQLTAENIARGQSSPAEVTSVWMASDGHRESILRPGLDQYGVGIAELNGQLVWVMDFAQH